MSEFLVKCIKPGACLHLKQGEVYSAYHANTYGGVTRSYVVFDNSGGRQRYMASRFEVVTPEQHRRSKPKMGVIYLVCVIEAVSLKNNNFDVLSDDPMSDNYIEHTLEGAKQKLEALQKDIDDGDDYTACIFELHSYYENRPFFVEVKR